MPSKYDVAVIGGGPGGYVAAIRCAQLGLRTVCIDKRDTLGGTCLNVGCIPSKALLHTTETYSYLQHEALEQGIAYQKLTLDFSTMMQRKDSIVKGLVDGVSGLFKNAKVDHLIGHASFVSPHILEIKNGDQTQQIEAAHIIIATGSDPIALPMLPFDEKRIVSSTGALSLAKVPKKLAVIGAGVIGVELASVYSRLGSEVIIIEMLDHICPAMDKAVSQQLLRILKKQGLTFLLSTQVVDAEATSKHVSLTLKNGNEESHLDVETVLVAVGRRPYTDGLGLDKVGINKTSKGFIPVDGLFRTNLPHVYAIGDVIEGIMLAHKASEEGVAAAEIIGGLRPHINYMAIPNVIYTAPEVAAVGLTEEEAKEAGLKVKVGTSSFKANPRARCTGQTDGMVKIIGEEISGRIVGMHIVGAHASEMIGEGVMAIEMKATLSQIAYASHAHPTFSECIKEAAVGAVSHK